MKPEPTLPTFDETLRRYQAYLSSQDFERLQACSRLPAPNAIRINRLKVNAPASFAADLAARYGWQLEPLPFSQDAWQVRAAQTPPSQTPEHQLGYFYLQDAASILPAALFDPAAKPELTLDMAASPGGKTTQLVDLQADTHLVVANDASASRLPALRTVLQLWGAANIAITQYNGEAWGDWSPDTFDRILLDAPCSMEGLRDTPTHPFRPTSSDERSRLAQRQVALLDSSLRALKPGGELVYSTCSLAPEEDEAVVDAILQRYQGLVSISARPEALALPAAFGEFAGQRFDPQVKASLRVWPFTFDTNGFFAVKLLKSAPLPSRGTAPKPQRPFRATGLRLLAPAVEQLLQDQVLEQYGFDLRAQLAIQGLELRQRDSAFWALPQAWLKHFAELPYHSLGMEIGSVLKGNFEASAEFTLRYAQAFTLGRATLPQDYLSQWLSGHDLRDLELPAEGPAKTIAVFSEDGLNLGAGKCLPGRLRNLLPRRNLRLN